MSTKKSNSERLSNPLRAWIIWLLSATFMFYKFALEVSPSVMTGTLMKTFHIGGVELGNLAACYFYAYLILQIPAGLLIDRFGPRKTTTLAIALCAVGSLVFAGADTLWMASVGRFLTGTGAAFAAVNCLKTHRQLVPFETICCDGGTNDDCCHVGRCRRTSTTCHFH
jgi:fucose permease